MRARSRSWSTRSTTCSLSETGTGRGRHSTEQRAGDAGREGLAKRRASSRVSWPYSHQSGEQQRLQPPSRQLRQTRRVEQDGTEPTSSCDKAGESQTPRVEQDGTEPDQQLRHSRGKLDAESGTGRDGAGPAAATQQGRARRREWNRTGRSRPAAATQQGRARRREWNRTGRSRTSSYDTAGES